MALLRSDLLAEAGFHHAFPERGTSDDELVQALGVARIATVKQVHGASAVDAAQAEAAPPGVVEADAIVGRAAHEPRHTVGVRVADCVPILLADRATGNVAAVHAGWRGVVGGVVRTAVTRLIGFELEPRRASVGADLVAAIGPCIGACCFEVGVDVAEAISAVSSSAAVVRIAAEKAFVDLRAAVRVQLRACGVASSAVEDVAGCTKHDGCGSGFRFHSFRRDGAGSGRMLAAIATRG